MVLFVKVVSEVSGVQELHEKVQIFPVLERKFHIDDEGMGIGLKPTEEFFFIHNWVDTSFGDDACFINDFQGVDFLGFFLHDFPNSAEAAFAYNFDEVEIAFVV